MNDELARDWSTRFLMEWAQRLRARGHQVVLRGDPLETTCNSNLNIGIEYGVQACLCIELDGKHNKLRVEKVDGSEVEFGAGNRDHRS